MRATVVLLAVATATAQMWAQTPVRYEPGHCPKGETGGDPWCNSDSRSAPTGEGVIGMSVDVPGGDDVTSHAPPCNGDPHPVVAAWLKDVARDSEASAAVLKEIIHRTPGNLRRWIVGNKSRCAVLAVRIPVGSRMTRIQTTIGGDGAGGPCGGPNGFWPMDLRQPSRSVYKPGWNAGGCSQWPKFQNMPESYRYTQFEPLLIGDDERTVVAVFKNWSTSGLTPLLRVYYKRTL